MPARLPGLASSHSAIQGDPKLANADFRARCGTATSEEEGRRLMGLAQKVQRLAIFEYRAS
jgi:hypothetical protein